MTAKIVAVASGKGGVGKSFVSVNLAVELGIQKKRVLIIDADVGLGNLHILLGINPKYNIIDLMEGESTFEETVASALEGKVNILAGGTGLDKIFQISPDRKKRLFSEFKKMEEMFDIIIIDIGAGINKEVISFIELADQVVVVTNPDITAMADAYAILKIMIKQETITKNLGLVINKADADLGEEVYLKLNNASVKFLQTVLKYMGNIEEDRKLVFQSTQKRMPIYYLNPSSKIRKEFYNLSLKVFYNKEFHYNNSSNFVSKFMRFLGIEV